MLNSVTIDGIVMQAEEKKLQNGSMIRFMLVQSEVVFNKERITKIPVSVFDSVLKICGPIKDGMEVHVEGRINTFIKEYNGQERVFNSITATALTIKNKEQAQEMQNIVMPDELPF